MTRAQLRKLGFTGMDNYTSWDTCWVFLRTHMHGNWITDRRVRIHDIELLSLFGYKSLIIAQRYTDTSSGCVIEGRYMQRVQTWDHRDPDRSEPLFLLTWLIGCYKRGEAFPACHRHEFPLVFNTSR